jgi:hypothetical protein
LFGYINEFTCTSGWLPINKMDQVMAAEVVSWPFKQPTIKSSLNAIILWNNLPQTW